MRRCHNHEGALRSDETSSPPIHPEERAEEPDRKSTVTRKKNGRDGRTSVSKKNAKEPTKPAKRASQSGVSKASHLKNDWHQTRKRALQAFEQIEGPGDLKGHAQILEHMKALSEISEELNADRK